jgi:nitrate reductase alpha subunit
MYRIVERKLGAYGWREFEDHEPVRKWRDAVEEADRLAAYRRAAGKRVWKRSVVVVKTDGGEQLYEVEA